MSEEPLDLRRSFAALRRRRKVLAGFALTGALLGSGYSVVRPPPATAASLVLLPPVASSSSSSGTPTRDMKTEVVIATSLPVLDAARRAVAPPAPIAALRSILSVTAVSEDVLRFEVRSTTGARAVGLANATAQAFVNYVRASSVGSGSNSDSGLRAEATQLTGQLQQLQQQVNSVSARLVTEDPHSAAAQTDTALVGSLRSEEEQASLALESVNSQIASGQLASGSADAATRILQNAALAPQASKVSRGVEYGLMGLAGGLLLGVITVLLRAHGDRRLRTRDEIARAVGVPVIGSLSSRARLSTPDWTRIIQGSPSTATESWALRRIVRHLLPDADRWHSVTVLSLSKDQAALSAGLRVARMASQMGVTTRLVVLDRPGAASLRAACVTVGQTAPPRDLVLDVDDDAVEDEPCRLLIRVVVADRLQPDTGPPGDLVVLAVSSGQADADELARMALASSQAGTDITGIVVVNADPADTTLGTPGGSRQPHRARRGGIQILGQAAHKAQP